MSAGAKVAVRALALVGAPFRLHGRDPETGLDCVGFAARALAIPARDVPTGYRLRGTSIARWRSWFDQSGFVAAEHPFRPGDLLLVEPGPSQGHLLVCVAGGQVHAHAALGRVVYQPGPPPWPFIAAWRHPEVEE